MKVCEALPELGFRPRTGKLWRHSQQIVKLLRSFAPSGSARIAWH
ncbi:hypothetical protein AB1L30_10960 [Bremerella sp. JC817]